MVILGLGDFRRLCIGLRSLHLANFRVKWGNGHIVPKTPLKSATDKMIYI